jgi:hypothetical protein
MKNNRVGLFCRGAFGAAVGLALTGCAAAKPLPDTALRDAAGTVVGKPITSVSNVRQDDELTYFDAQASDGTTYACSVRRLFGISSDHQKCDKK